MSDAGVLDAGVVSGPGPMLRRARESRGLTPQQAAEQLNLDVSVVDALEDGARNTLAVAMACACAGIVIGCVTITGLGIVFTQMVVALAQNSLILALVLTALAGIVLGMGMPTTPAYIMMVALLVPAVIKLGAATPAAHMFAFYFAILSAITLSNRASLVGMIR